MTPPSENPQQQEPDQRLEKILATVRSIDRNVEAILEMLNDEFHKDTFHPEWARDYDAYLDENHY